MNNLTTINSISILGKTIIAEIDISDNDEIILNSSKDSNIIVLSVISHSEENNKIFILSKVGSFYIKEKEIKLTDKNVSKEFGKNIAINKFNNDYIVAISDTEYLSSNGVDSVGCVFIYRFVPNNGWKCTKQLTFIDNTDELRYRRFGNILEFVNNDLYIGCIDNCKKFDKDKEQYSNSLLIYRSDNYCQFLKTEIFLKDDWLDIISNVTYVRDNKFYFLFILNKNLLLGSINPMSLEPNFGKSNIQLPKPPSNSVEYYELAASVICNDFENHVDGDISNLRIINNFLFMTIYEKREFISHVFNVVCLNMSTNVSDFLHNTIFHIDRKEDTKSLFYSIDSNDNGIFISALKTFKDNNIINNLEIVKITTNCLSKESIYSSNIINKKEVIETSINLYNKKKMLKVLDNQLLFIEDVVISDGRRKCLLKSKDIT